MALVTSASTAAARAAAAEPRLRIDRTERALFLHRARSSFPISDPKIAGFVEAELDAMLASVTLRCGSVGL